MFPLPVRNLCLIDSNPLHSGRTITLNGAHTMSALWTWLVWITAEDSTYVTADFSVVNLEDAALLEFQVIVHWQVYIGHSFVSVDVHLLCS